MTPRLAFILGTFLWGYAVLDVVTASGRPGTAELGLLGVVLAAQGVLGAGLARLGANAAPVALLAWGATGLVLDAARGSGEGPVLTALLPVAAMAMTWGLVASVASSPAAAARSAPVALSVRVLATFAAGAVALWVHAPSSPLGGAPVSGAVVAVAALVVVLAAVRAAKLLGAREPSAHAAAAWGVLGAPLGVAFVVALVARAPVWAALLGFAWIGVHVATRVPSWAARVGPVTRGAVAVAVGAGVFAGGAALFTRAGGAFLSPFGAGVACAVGAVVAVALGGSLVRRRLAPYAGRLLAAAEDATRELDGVDGVDTLARAVLRPLRAGSGALDAEPVLYTAVPAREIRIDAAGEPRTRAAAIPDAIVRYFAIAPGTPLVRDAIAHLVVRRPELRAALDALDALDAVAAFPILAAGELEGVLVVARGARTLPLRLEEVAALEGLASRMGGILALLSAKERAEARLHVSEAARGESRERLERAEREADRLRALVEGLGQVQAIAEPVAYGPAMRAALELLAQRAGDSWPVLLLAEPGVDAIACAQLLHRRSPRADRPLVVKRAAAFAAEMLPAGDLGAPAARVMGWAAEADGGTLVLEDALALPPAAQRALVDLEGARVVAIAREMPVASDRTSSEFVTWLGAGAVRVPPLRERREDLPSLVLALLDRCARAQGRAPVGIDREALERLLAHPFPGNELELALVVDRAVARAQGPRVMAADLPLLWVPDGAAGPDPFDGTYDELEQRILERALARAGGNKSEAARLLGLKRTTFLDKLRRFGLEDGARPKGSAPN